MVSGEVLEKKKKKKRKVNGNGEVCVLCGCGSGEYREAKQCRSGRVGIWCQRDHCFELVLANEKLKSVKHVKHVDRIGKQLKVDR